MRTDGVIGCSNAAAVPNLRNSPSKLDLFPEEKKTVQIS